MTTGHFIQKLRPFNLCLKSGLSLFDKHHKNKSRFIKNIIIFDQCIENILKR